MSRDPITHDKLSAAVTKVLPGIIEKLRAHYGPPEPLDDFARNEMKYTDESNLAEHIAFYDRHYSQELLVQAIGLRRSLDKSDAEFKSHLIAWLTADRTAYTPLAYGNLNYMLVDALIDELGIRGEIGQQIPRTGGQQV